MAYSEDLAGRVRDLLAGHEGLTEKKLFGGIAFFIQGNMCCGVTKDDLVVRVGPEGFEAALSQPHARPMDFTGRALKGFVYVGPAGHRSDAALAKWVKRGVAFAASLPPK